MQKIIPLIVVPLALAGCGGTSTTTAPSFDVAGFTANSSTVTSGSHFSSVGYDGSISSGGMTASLTTIASGEPGGFSEVASVSNNGATGLTGNATFNGNYVGSWADPIGDLEGIASGTASLTLTGFGGSPTISGAITNRTLMTSSGQSVIPFSDIGLSSTSVNAGTGAFSGTATGGEYGNLILDTHNGGTYSGLVGAGGTAVGGQLNLNISYTNGNTYSETGIFLAN